MTPRPLYTLMEYQEAGVWSWVYVSEHMWEIQYQIGRAGFVMPWKVTTDQGRTIVDRGHGQASVVEIPEPES